MPSDSHKTPSDTCARCGYVFDAATAMIHSAEPEPGDLSICLRCGDVTQFSETLHHAPLSATEWDALPEDLKMNIYRMQQARRKVMKGADR